MQSPKCGILFESLTKAGKVIRMHKIGGFGHFDSSSLFKMRSVERTVNWTGPYKRSLGQQDGFLH